MQHCDLFIVMHFADGKIINNGRVYDSFEGGRSTSEIISGPNLIRIFLFNICDYLDINYLIIVSGEEWLITKYTFFYS